MESPEVLRVGMTEAAAHDAFVLLAALGVSAAVESDVDGRSSVIVAAADLARAREILAEADAEAEAEVDGSIFPGESDAASGSSSAVDPRAARGSGPPPVEPWSWRGPGSAAVLTVVLACAAAFLVTSGGAPTASYERMVDRGAITAGRIDDGEVWRLAAAVFLHFDLAHLLTNMATLLLVGPLLAQVIGPYRFLAVFVGSGVAGNLASYLLAPSPALKAGASGAVAGVIGALAGQALRAGRGGRFRPWQILGAAVAMYALVVGAAANSDHVAHLGGLVSGVVLGHLLAPPDARSTTSDASALAGRTPPA